MSDTVSDLLTSLRNAVRLHKSVVELRETKIGSSILDALRRSGFIWEYSRFDREGRAYLRVALKYTPGGGAVMRSLTRVSKPGNRVFVGVDKIPSVQQRLGVSLLSTNRGVLSGIEAGSNRVGGELICSVY